MKPAPNLRVVDQANPPLDITLANRADILTRDWSACHIAADKRRPIDLREPRRWGWR